MDDEIEGYDETQNINNVEWTIYPENTYKFEYNDTTIGKGLIFDQTEDIIQKRIRNYARNGMRITVCGLLLCHNKGFPHIILIKRNDTESYGLLGGKCKVYENPREKLSYKLARFITNNSKRHKQLNIKDSIDNIKVGELLAEFWRCDFHTDPLPYLPLHTNRPKEKISIFQVTLNDNCIISVPSDISLKAVPLHDFYDTQYGIAIGSLPHLISKFNFSFMSID